MITSFFKPKSKTATPEPSTQSKKAKRRTAPGDDESDSSPESSNKRMKTITSDNVQELLSYLKTPVSVPGDGKTWNDVLQKHFESASFARLATFVATQRKSYKVYPPAPDTFSALNWTPLDQVKVVIVGQDPYHQPNQAHGLCFSVRRGIKIPPSLRNMYKELIQDPGVENFTNYPVHGNLERWARQGVLMINSVLTVRESEANSHKNKGWELFTDEIIRAVDRRVKQNRSNGGKEGVVFLLWGKPATEKCQTALGVSNMSLNTQGHRKIICTSHPSPLGATKTDSPFLGSKCFSKANEALKEFGYEKGIDWRVDGEF